MKSARKYLIAMASAAAFGCGSAVAAPIYPVFSVDPTVLGAAGPEFDANKIVGNYNEALQINPDGTFRVAIRWLAGQYSLENSPPPSTDIPALQSGLGVNYSMYAYFDATGSISTNMAGDTIFTLDPGGALSLFKTSTVIGLTFNFDSTAFAWEASDLSDTVAANLLGSGNAVEGEGSVKAGGQCGTGLGIDCGSFGQTSSFALTALGSTYFTSPVPFYSLTFASGQFNDVFVASTDLQFTNGSVDVVFGSVPEPGSALLVGLALTAVGLVTRRRRSL
jgi:hypothetical protein